MTGFGRGESEAAGHRIVVEIRSVNHRFLNTQIRLPREYGRVESALTSRCAGRCERGHLSVQVDVEPVSDGDGKGPRLDREILERVLGIARELEGRSGIRPGLSIDALLASPGVVDWEPSAAALDEDAFSEAVVPVLDRALDELVASREEEGRALADDLRARIEAIADRRAELERLAPVREERERERLVEKVATLVPAGTNVEDRIAQEIALLADRLDVSEELMRLGAHLERFGAEIDGADGAVGRKLTFLLQELLREANTIAAKSNDAAMQQLAVEIKAELEKMREQAENVE